MIERRNKLTKAIGEKGFSCALFHRPANIRYLSGYAGEGCLLIVNARAVIITDFRYTEQASRQAPDCEVFEAAGAAKVSGAILSFLQAESVNRMMVETDFLTVDDYQAMKDALPGVELAPAGRAAEALRALKDETEAGYMHQAAEIASKAFDWMLNYIKPGMTEMDIRVELDYRLKKLGSTGESFSSIVCAGPNGSLPHAVPSDRPVGKGELLTMDFGAEIEGYKSDMTRTIAIGEISDELQDIYNTVLDAQLAALELIRPGAVCKDIDLAARERTDAKYPGAFGHGLGHGVGLMIHEEPRLSRLDSTVLQPGHVVTVEPGIYIPGLGGCRIEDMGIVTKDGFFNMTSAPKRLITI